MPARAVPLPLRNALAALALAAFDDPAARAALAWLARPEGTPPADAAERLAARHLVDPGAATLLAVHQPWADAVATHAHRAVHAAARAPAPGDDSLTTAIIRAAALWSEGLFFEVHEVLEAVWQPTSGPVRQALQGLIQIAAAWYHLGHGNRRGARTLLRDGRQRLAEAAEALPMVDSDALLAATAPFAAALATGQDPPAGSLPPLVLRVAS